MRLQREEGERHKQQQEESVIKLKESLKRDEEESLKRKEEERSEREKEKSMEGKQEEEKTRNEAASRKVVLHTSLVLMRQNLALKWLSSILQNWRQVCVCIYPHVCVCVCVCLCVCVPLCVCM